MGRLLHSIELANLVQGVDTWRETTVETEDLVFNDSRQGQVVKKLSELLPDVGVTILAQALVIESVSKHVRRRSAHHRLNNKMARCNKVFGRVQELQSQKRVKLRKPDNLHLGDLTRLVVAPQDSDSVLIAHLECDEQSDCLDTIVAAIDVVAHKEVVCVGRLASNLEKLAQIMELAMNVAANSHWRTHLLHV